MIPPAQLKKTKTASSANLIRPPTLVIQQLAQGDVLKKNVDQKLEKLSTTNNAGMRIETNDVNETMKPASDAVSKTSKHLTVYGKGSSSSVVEKNEEPLPKKQRMDKVDKEYYDSIEKTFEGLASNAVAKVKACNAQSLNRILELEAESCGFQKRIHQLEGENSSQKKTYETMMKKLREENANLQKENTTLQKNAKICFTCGKTVNALFFCGDACQEKLVR